MIWPQDELNLMHAALNQAESALYEGEVPVGAVVFADGNIIGKGHNKTISQRDPSAHAEIVALRDAGSYTGNHRLIDATLYVTLEPCIMCLGAIVQSRVKRVVFGAYDRKSGVLGSVEDLSKSSSLNHQFEISGGLLEKECAALLKNFFKSRR